MLKYAVRGFMAGALAFANCALAQRAVNTELIKLRGVVHYDDFGAHGDGKTDDMEILARAHAFANEHNFPVKANSQAVYYLGSGGTTIAIETSTDFGTARFIIDDRNVQKRSANIFAVRSQLAAIRPTELKTIKRGQTRLDLNLPHNCVVVAQDKDTKRFIRRGRNQNAGSAQTDVFMVARDGTVNTATPIIWDFERISSLVAYPIDNDTLQIKGGRFTTVANAAESNYTYYARGLGVQRSNVIIQGLEHRVRGEGEHGAPYRGFIDISECAFVSVCDTTLHGHKTYNTTGSAGKPVSMGTYDISVTRALNVSFVNCRQFDDINDRSRWGIMGSNFCKNLMYDNCRFSRFDAHQGVVGVVIRNSILGYMGINAIGSGRFLVQNTTVYGTNFINLRSDYGSTWQGEFVIQNCKFVPANGRAINASLVGGFNDGQHNFGYTCYMPHKIVIDGLEIDDSNHPTNYQGPSVLANFNSAYVCENYQEKFPYHKTAEVHFKNVTTASGQPLNLSKNPVMFSKVAVH